MINTATLSNNIKQKAPEFGFLEATIANVIIGQTAQNEFDLWLTNKFNGTMDYLQRNRQLRFNPPLLHNNTVSIICVKAPYLTYPPQKHLERLNDTQHAYISNYALGRDYHKVVKKQLKLFAEWIQTQIFDLTNEFSYRVFSDSAPILEIELAKNSGLGFRGKNTLLLHKNHGSTFFLGEIFTNLPLKYDSPVSSHCGSCTKCLTACPTNAFTAPYVLDARKCISYLTIENKGAIPIELRKQIGNRIYGCDDCQLVCPWNKFSRITKLPEFAIRHNLDTLSLVEAFSWNENLWQQKMQGSAIYRIGYNAWLRNVAVALGNAKTSSQIINSLKDKLSYPSSLVREHIVWALEQHGVNVV
jgi:epoxyqueuosine reductase